MWKLGFDVNKNAMKQLFACFVFLISLYLAMISVTTLLLGRITHNSQSSMQYLLGQVTSNTYTSMFIIGFCVVLFAALKRFNVINDCIK